MATSLEPLLHSSQIKSSHCKSLYLVIFLAAIVIPITLFSIPHIKTISNDPLHVMQIEDMDQLQGFLKESISDLDGVMEMAIDVKRRMNDPRGEAPLADCVELMDLSMGRIGDSIEVLGRGTVHSHEDAHAWLSGVLTNYVTCIDGMNGTSRISVERGLKQLISRAETSLAMLVAISPAKEDVLQPLQSEFPPWIDMIRDRKLLESSSKDIKANVVVAQDGSGNYKTVKDAIASVPKNSKTRYVIHVKKGIYKENVEIGKSQKNLMMVGDGMNSTVITGSLNVIDGSTTFKSATVGKVLTRPLSPRSQ